MSKIRFRDRLRARNAAREIWVASQTDPNVKTLLDGAMDGDDESARLLLSTHPEMPQSIDPATLFLLIQIALKLWMWWQQNKVKTPSEAISIGEPFDASIESSDDE